MGKIVTFYSYKGGTGRSMALANVAWVLASRGARVLVVDWDLEAPGLHRYFRPFLPDKDLTRLESQGVIDFVVDFSERLAARSGSVANLTDPDWYQPYADISKWTQRLLWPSGEDAQTMPGGYIDFVPAGRQGPQYARKVNSFDWVRFYERYNGGSFMEAVRTSMARYDWVLLDSRTGVSDTSGICTIQFPDVLVVCFTLNYQSIDGAAAVAASAKAARTNRPLRILPLPTRLDGNEEKLLKAMLRYAQRAFNPLLESHVDAVEYWIEMGVPYFSRYAYSEKLSPFEDQVNVSTSTLPSIERLTARITEGRIAKLEPLPEPHREAVLAEFERLADADTPEVPPAAGEPAASRLRRAAARSLYGLRSWSAWPVALGTAALLLAIGYALFRSGTGPQGTGNRFVATLTADARKDIENNRREHAALLIAEAASRLGADAIVSAGSQPAGQLFDAFLALQPLVLSKDSTGARTVQFSPNGRWIASAAARQPARLFRFGLPAPQQGLPIGYSAAAFSADSRYVAVGDRNATVSVYDTLAGERLLQSDSLDAETAWISAIAFSPTGRLVAVGSDRGVALLTIPRGGIAGKGIEAGGVTTLAFTPDGSLLAWGSRGGVVGAVADLAGGTDSVAFPTFKVGGPVKTIAFGASSSTYRTAMAVVTDNGSVSALTFADRRWSSVRALPTRGTAIALTSSGDTLAVASDKSVNLFRVADLAPIATLAAPQVRSVAFSSDGRAIVTGGDDRVVRVWDVSSLRPQSGAEQQAPKAAATPELARVTLSQVVAAVAIDATGKYVAIGSADGTSVAFTRTHDRELSFSASEVQDLACSQARETSLPAAEWTRYFGSEPVRFTCRPPTASDVPRPSRPPA